LCEATRKAAASEIDDAADDAPANAAVTDFTMGIQSQLCEGAINSKKIGTKVKSK
jgi:hypothetical protein